MFDEYAHLITNGLDKDSNTMFTDWRVDPKFDETIYYNEAFIQCIV